MKRMKRFTAAVLVLVCAMSLMACGSKKGSIVGTWVIEGTDSDISALELKEDGTGSISIGGTISLNITYATDNNKLTMTMTYLGQTDTEEYTYSIKDSKLILEEDGEQITFVKSK